MIKKTLAGKEKEKISQYSIGKKRPEKANAGTSPKTGIWQAIPG